MPGRSKSERAGWLALLVLVLTAALSAIACEESTSEAPPAPAEAEPAQAEPADQPTPQPEEADAPEQPQRRAETSQSEASEDEEPAPVEPEVEETEPAAASASTPDDAAEEAPAGAAAEEAEAPEEPANGAATSEAPEPAQDPAAVEDEEPQPRELAVVVPDRPEAITLYAGPAIDWAALATLAPGAPLTIIGRAPDLVWPKDGWLLAEMPDGTRGWLTADDLALDPDTLAVLRELQPSGMEVITSVPEGAWIRAQPDHASPGCALTEGGPATVGGRSPDGEWSLVSFAQVWCRDPAEWYYGEGWIHGADLEYDPMLSRVPVVYPDGLWLFPVDPQIQPSRLPVRVYDTWSSEAWSFDPEDGSLVFADHYSSTTRELKRYTPGTGELTFLSRMSGYNILVAPVGGRVLMMAREDRESYAPYRLTLLHPDGRTEDIGHLWMYCRCARANLLQRQARWASDGQTIIVGDTPFPEQTDPDYSDLWLYHVVTGKRVDLRKVTVAAGLRLMNVQFHPDGQSIYAFAIRSNRYDGVLHRLTLEGDEWPGFSPIESRRVYRISPRGDEIVASVDGKWHIFTDQGELLGERADLPDHWFPSGDSIAYLTDGRPFDGVWTIEHLPSGRTNQIHLPDHPHWSPNGEHVAVVDWTNEWIGRSSVDFGMLQLRMYDISGRLLSAHRLKGCYHSQWLADGSQFAVSVFPDCAGP
ncbi:MAG: hypothetical protein OXG38_10590 [Chloroflexi bacterium]|nr:hypothetical protein [Chloroflexota bacterium]